MQESIDREETGEFTALGLSKFAFDELYIHVTVHRNIFYIHVTVHRNRFPFK